MKVREIKNGRLAMIAFLGFTGQYLATQKGPVDNLIDHLKVCLYFPKGFCTQDCSAAPDCCACSNSSAMPCSCNALTLRFSLSLAYCALEL